MSRINVYTDAKIRGSFHKRRTRVASPFSFSLLTVGCILDIAVGNKYTARAAIMKDCNGVPSCGQVPKIILKVCGFLKHLKTDSYQRKSAQSLVHSRENVFCL